MNSSFDLPVKQSAMVMTTAQKKSQPPSGGWLWVFGLYDAQGHLSRRIDWLPGRSSVVQNFNDNQLHSWHSSSLPSIVASIPQNRNLVKSRSGANPSVEYVSAFRHPFLLGLDC
jgi:hypothetical protein